MRRRTNAEGIPASCIDIRSASNGITRSIQDYRIDRLSSRRFPRVRARANIGAHWKNVHVKLENDSKGEPRGRSEHYSCERFLSAGA